MFGKSARCRSGLKDRVMRSARDIQWHSQVLNVDFVAAMSEPPGCVHGRDGRERFRYRLDQSLAGACPHLTNDALGLGERFFYGV